MYLDKPMRDHTLLQAIARVNRPYENEAQEMVKPHGFVLDFVGIFDKLEKALAFDSDEINAIVKDLALLKSVFQSKMELEAPKYLALIQRNFNDKDVENLIEYFRDADRRKVFFKEFKEIEMLYEIISPDAFLRPYIEPFTSLAAIYSVVRKAYTKTVYVDRDFQRKTDQLVRENIGTYGIGEPGDLVAINGDTIEVIKAGVEGSGTKVINLIKSIQKTAEEESDDPYLIAMAERALAVQQGFEDRQTSTAEALAALLKEVAVNETRKTEQAEKGFDGLTYFVYRTLLDERIGNAEGVSRKVKAAFIEFPNWRKSDNALRELRKKVTFALLAESDDVDGVATIVNNLFSLLDKVGRI
jgi:type I restriction enzyme R subunit